MKVWAIYASSAAILVAVNGEMHIPSLRKISSVKSCELSPSVPLPPSSSLILQRSLILFSGWTNFTGEETGTKKMVFIDSWMNHEKNRHDDFRKWEKTIRRWRDRLRLSLLTTTYLPYLTRSLTVLCPIHHLLTSSPKCPSARSSSMTCGILTALGPTFLTGPSQLQLMASILTGFSVT